MPRYRDRFPRINKQYHHGVWRMRWRWNDKTYAIATSITDEDAVSDIEAIARNLSSQLASLTRPTVSPPWDKCPGMVRYLNDRYGGIASISKQEDVGEWLTDYRHEIQGKNTPGWVRDSISMLMKLDHSANGLNKVTDRFAATYMAAIAAKPPKRQLMKKRVVGSPGTHNRTLTVFKKFFTWLVNTDRHDSNPFATIKRLKERKDTPITYCTRKERDELIELAKATGWPEWEAVFIAFHLGLRKEEIANLEWEHIRFDNGTIQIGKTKTGTPRTIPLPTVLEKFLDNGRERKGFIVQVKEGENRLERLKNLTKRMKKNKFAALLEEWNIEKPAPSRAKEYKEKKEAFKSAVAKHADAVDSAMEHIGWNVFRHTFASLKVQSGVDVQKVARWIGDTLATCMLHYAQFVPKDKRDPDIDRE